MKSTVMLVLACFLSFSFGGALLQGEENLLPQVETVLPEVSETPNQGESTLPEEPETPNQEETVLPEEPQVPDTSETEAKALVVIDAGHQLNGNSDKEPNGPGSSITKAKVSSGTTGAYTGIPEYVLTLAVALMLEEILVDWGYEVVQIRSTHEVDISNAERAIIANELNADAFIRLHGNGFSDSSVNGALTMCMTSKNPYCSYLYENSRLLSELVLDGIIAETGANRRTILESDSMTGLNWCEVPVTIVEMGFMSNKKEDELLATEEYRYSVALGIALGIENYIQAIS
ncbi:MAG: N-acetylmuramoyl-L-alanine amidase [Eubacteriales bacterium]